MRVSPHCRGLSLGAMCLLMEYKGIRYTIRARIERGEWFVAIHPSDVEMPGKIVSGDRERAETLAHLMINKWLDR